MFKNICSFKSKLIVREQNSEKKKLQMKEIEIVNRQQK